MENTPRLSNWGLYALAVLIGTIIFALVFIVANNVSKSETQQLLNSQFESSYNIFKDKWFLSNSYMLCQNFSLTKISKDIYTQGAIIADLEERLGKNDERVLAQKKFYTLILLEHLDFVKQMNQKCGFKIQTVLFFYSNLPKEVDNSEKIGYLLNTLVDKNPSLRVYSFDVNLDDSLILFLKEKYNVTSPLLVIVNEKVRIEEVKDMSQIENLIFK